MEYAAGGVVYQPSARGPLIGFILDPYHKWTFPKGHIERGEKPETAAKRETEEEMGLGGLHVIAPLGKTDLWFYERYRQGKRVFGPKTMIHKPVQYFLMEASRGARAKPEREEMIHAVSWVPISEAEKTLNYKNTKPILLRAIELIRSRERSLLRRPRDKVRKNRR